jgi:hypothetical protein
MERWAMKQLINSLAWLAESGARLPRGLGWFRRAGVSAGELS